MWPSLLATNQGSVRPWSPRMGLAVHHLRDNAKVGRFQRSNDTISGCPTVINPLFSGRPTVINSSSLAIIREWLGENCMKKTANSLKLNAKAVVCCGVGVNHPVIAFRSCLLVTGSPAMRKTQSNCSQFLRLPNTL